MVAGTGGQGGGVGHGGLLAGSEDCSLAEIAREFVAPMPRVIDFLAIIDEIELFLLSEEPA